MEQRAREEAGEGLPPHRTHEQERAQRAAGDDQNRGVERLDERVGGGEEDVRRAGEEVGEDGPEREEGEEPVEETAADELRGTEVRQEVGHPVTPCVLFRPRIPRSAFICAPSLLPELSAFSAFTSVRRPAGGRDGPGRILLSPPAPSRRNGCLSQRDAG